MRRGAAAATVKPFTTVRWRLEFPALQFLDVECPHRTRLCERRAGHSENYVPYLRLTERRKSRQAAARAAPANSDATTIMAEAIDASGWNFNHFEGQLHWQHDEARLSHGELVGDFGTFAGNILYRPEAQEAEFDINGTGISLDKVKKLQTPSMPLRGRADFTLRGKGPLLSPVAQGNFHVRNLTVGSREAGGTFSGQQYAFRRKNCSPSALASEPSNRDSTAKSLLACQAISRFPGVYPSHSLTLIRLSALDCTFIS